MEKKKFEIPACAFVIHGHNCPFMPIGYRMGTLALQKMGVERSKDHEMMLEAHIDLYEDYSISRFEVILEQVDKLLEPYGIHHFNIQPELFRSDQKELINTGKGK